MPLDPCDHTKLAWSIAAKYLNVPDHEAVVAVALLALVRSAQAFDETLGHRPSSFLVPVIKNAVLDEARRQRKQRREVPLYIVNPDGEEKDRPDLPVVEPVAVQRVLDREVREAVEKLPERERQIVEARYGLGDGEPATAGQVADEVGLSRQRVTQVAARGVRRLRERLTRPARGTGYASS